MRGHVKINGKYVKQLLKIHEHVMVNIFAEAYREHIHRPLDS